VERRREDRFKPNQAAIVRVLGLNPGPVIHASVLDLSGSGMRLRSNLPVPCGTSVEVEANHAVAHGAVSRCEPVQDFYELAIQVSTIYTNTIHSK
jgi:hypothetical protein